MIKIISGGQTGVDRGALDAALDAGVECGGWCPAGRLAEDGKIPEKYPLTEIRSPEYRKRTLQNVIDSDATLILYFGELEGGTALTLSFCKQYNKPNLTINAEKFDEIAAAKLIYNFTSERRVRILNVAGPRASKVAIADNFSANTIAQFIRLSHQDS